MNEKHTPTPWRAIGEAIGSEKVVICSCDWHADPDFENDGSIPETQDEAQANAAHIVHCVNSFDQLVSALDQSLTALKAALPHYKISAIMGDTEDHKTAQVIMDGMKAVNTALKDAGKESNPC